MVSKKGSTLMKNVNGKEINELFKKFNWNIKSLVSKIFVKEDENNSCSYSKIRKEKIII